MLIKLKNWSRVLFILLITALLTYLVGISDSPLILKVQAQSCPVPSQVQNVNIEYPYCIGSQCDFTKGNCTWSSVAGATKYQVTISQVETGSTVLSQQVEASVTNQVFTTAQSNTYKCEVAAINSCGTSGTAGSFSLFCKIDAAVTIVPTSTPQAQSSCGFPCTQTSGCQSGLTCAVGSNGQGYCALPALASACQNSPSISSCCTVATPTTPPAKPTVKPTGNIGTGVALGLASVLLILIGGALFIW